MTDLTTPQTAQPVEDSPAVPGVDPEMVEADIATEAGSDIVVCTTCDEPGVNECRRCKTSLCMTHSYHEEGSTLYYCRACADDLVGVCEVCEALHTRACRECGMKVCEAHQKRIIERWGWGGAPGQGGVTSWFPVLRTYCQEHSRGRLDVPKPELSTFKGFDASSPEW